MREILNDLFEQKTLDKERAKAILKEIADGKYSECEMASFLTVFCMRPITVEEFSGFRAILQELCVRVDLGGIETIDMCGTGGDGKHTINISTLSSFVMAGAGIKVAKHGNYAVSSGCGSSNVLEALGYKFTSDVSLLKKSIDTAGICFMHAPLFHPAMKAVGPVRRALGVKTFFNSLGPLINPAFPSRQVTGVYNKETARLYKYVLEKTAIDFTIIYSLDGYDEISLTSPFLAITKAGEEIISPQDLGLKQYTHADIAGGSTVPEATKIFTNILSGKGSAAQNDVIAINAAYGIKCVKPGLTIKECMSQARQSLESGAARQVLDKLLAVK